MKSGDKYNILTPHGNPEEFIKSLMPKIANESNWNVLQLSKEDELGNDYIIVSGSEIEAVKFFGSK